MILFIYFLLDLLGPYDYNAGLVSGTVYSINKDIRSITKEVYGKTSYTNPLHTDVFPGVCKMEAEVVRISVNLFHGDSNACGCVNIIEKTFPLYFINHPLNIGD